MIQNRGLDAYWTKIITQNKGGYRSSFETKLITVPPIFNAIQQRFQILNQNILALKDGAKILSVPAGFLPEFTEELILRKKFYIDACDLDSSYADKSQFDHLHSQGCL